MPSRAAVVRWCWRVGAGPRPTRDLARRHPVFRCVADIIYARIRAGTGSDKLSGIGVLNAARLWAWCGSEGGASCRHGARIGTGDDTWGSARATAGRFAALLQEIQGGGEVSLCENRSTANAVRWQ